MSHCVFDTRLQRVLCSVSLVSDVMESRSHNKRPAVALPPLTPAKMASPNHALVFGASGIPEWGPIHQLLSYPTKDTWSSIVGLMICLLSKSDTLLPDDDRISLVSGVDLSGSPEGLIATLKGKSPQDWEGHSCILP